MKIGDLTLQVSEKCLIIRRHVPAKPLCHLAVQLQRPAPSVGNKHGQERLASCRRLVHRRTTVASYLREWLATRKPHLAPNTYAGYAACVERDLIPAFGHLRLLDLRPEHIDAWVTAQLAANRGRVTVYRAVSTLRNALNAAVRSWRLRYNPAKHSVPPKPRAERTCWTPEQAATSCGTVRSSTRTS
ncbi:hypothetical protein [Kitasatospora sp. NBC_00315]|uniref:hypothetical protein n=1 Tax=Kitasatospora sp. NBC_00315 TaxID=2975963 RepID=UPI0032457C7A